MAQKEYYINIDSRHRNRSIWPSSANFEVKLDPPSGFDGASIQKSFKNLVSIEILHVIFPNANNVLNGMYLNLHIPEIDPIIDTTNSGTKCLAKLVPDKIIGAFVHSYQDINTRPYKTYVVKGARLDKLTIELRDANGELFDFGADNALPGQPNPLLQTSLMLKIVVDECGVF